ncbi:MAG: hypothetical protein ACAH81_08340, partial [Actinomycetota bacterium]
MTAGVRARTTVAAVLVVGAALIIATVAMELKLSDTLTAGIEDAATLTAESIAGAIEHGTITPEIATGDPDEEFVQVVDPSGVVIASTDNLGGRDPVADLEGGETTVVEGLPLDEGEGEFIVVAHTTATDEGMQTVLVGRALEPVSESTGAVAGF